MHSQSKKQKLPPSKLDPEEFKNSKARKRKLKELREHDLEDDDGTLPNRR